MPERVAERRRTPRYPVNLRVEWSSGEGGTRDVSFGGVFFETDQLLRPGVPLTFSMVLEHVDPTAPIRLGCEGEVVRVERRSGQVGVAAVIASHWLEPSE